MERNGQLVSYDNRRLLVAREAGLSEVPVEMVEPNAIMPGSKKTWEKQYRKRFRDGRNQAFGGDVPNTGLSTEPVVVPKEK